MKKTFQSIFSVPWYPLVFGAYPVLALMAVNTGQIKAESGLRALSVSVAFALILFLLLHLIMRSWAKAAFLSTLWLALFFSYGHVRITLTKEWKDIEFEQWLLIGWGVLALLAVLWAVKKPPASPVALNVITLGLAIVSLWQISSGLRRGGVHYVAAENAPVQEDLVRPENPPDVYYFILDSYGRADALEIAYGFDNSEFLNALQARGFYVAECSMANYTRTELSLGSSLNMAYLQDLDSTFTPDSTKRRRLWNSLKYSAVRYNFETLGYKTVAFATGFDWNEVDDSDVFFTPPPFAVGMTEFETLFMQTTLATKAQDLGWVDMDAIVGQNFRDRTTLVFDSIDDIVQMPEPTFAYIHLISPHPPFVFGPNGEYTNPADFWNEDKEYPSDLYAKGYQNQLRFLNKQMLQAVDTILRNSDVPPIIVIQGDHGPWLQPRDRHMWILNVYYLPEQQEKLFSKISPVNTFRYVFNAYFGGKYDMLPNISYFSPVPKLYEFSEIKNNCK